MNLRALLFVLIVGGCAETQPLIRAPDYRSARAAVSAPDTRYAIVTTPDDTAYTAGSYGQPSAIPEPIRVPQQQPVNFDGSNGAYGYDDLGRQGMAEGDSSKAEINFERALEVNPFDAVALNNLAVAKAEQGQFHEATAMLERAAKLSPDNADVAANLARLRGYVQGYAIVGMEPLLPKSATGALPAPPPPLWGSVASSSRYSNVSEGAYASEPTVLTPQDYYISEACSRKAATGKKGKVDIDCEPRR